jgi:hypothetical protein
MKLGELCRRLGVEYRHARYVLEEGILPAGAEESPGRGEHRDLTAAQAFWLGIVLLLKKNGIKTSLAGAIADFAHEGVRGIGMLLGWDHGFSPFLGRFNTDYEWYLDIGDLTYVRMATTAEPSYGGKLREFPWSAIGKRRKDERATPLVTIRLDIGRLAQLFREDS